jgi:2-(1,2-epoxy-1,2-dihydrophenyl)acetyl-CoA isomerase
MSQIVRSELRGRVRWVTLDNPEKKNALDRAAMAALGDAFRASDADDDTRVVVLTGAGKAFCTGADLVAAQKSLRPEGAAPKSEAASGSDDSEFNATIRALWNCQKPVIAAVNGIAAGFGCSVVLASDVRIASSAARLSLVFVKRGLALDGGASFFLPRLAGLNGLEMALTGDVVSAEEAARLGLVNRVVPEAELHDHVSAFAERMAKNAPLALAAIKQAVHRALGAALDEVLADELATVKRLVRTEDVREGIASFLEKRDPVFRGR